MDNDELPIVVCPDQQSGKVIVLMIFVLVGVCICIILIVRVFKKKDLPASATLEKAKEKITTIVKEKYEVEKFTEFAEVK